jgi:O-methyltransferase
MPAKALCAARLQDSRKAMPEEVFEPEKEIKIGITWPNWTTWPNANLNIRELPIYTQIVRAMPRMWMPNVVEALVRNVASLRDVPGDIVECGVFRGGCSMVLAAAAEFYGPWNAPKRHVYGFDTFAGAPENSEFDIEPPGKFADTDFEEVVEATKEYSNLTFIEGMFQDTLPFFKKSVALALLDCDLYDSYRTAIQYLWPQLQSNGVMLLADIRSGCPGADKAVTEMLPDEIEDFYGIFGIRKRTMSTSTSPVHPPGM